MRQNQYLRIIKITTLVACISIFWGCGISPLADRSPNVNQPPLHYIERGTGEPVILVHGFSQTHEMWLDTPVFQRLNREYRVIAVDLLGHGNSNKPHEPSAYGRNLESTLIDLLDYLEIERAHFVGFSMGASVIGGLLESSPERVMTATMGSGLIATWDEGEEEFARWTLARGQSDERYPWEPENQDFSALAAVIRGVRDAVITDSEISEIQTPTLIVFGSVELSHMAESQKRRLNHLPEKIQTLIIEGADHDSTKAAVLSDEFSQAVVQLIAENPMK